MAQTKRTNRRDFLRTTTAAGVGFWVAAGVSIPESRAANETINFACIGVGGKGSSDSEDCERNGNIVAASGEGYANRIDCIAALIGFVRGILDNSIGVAQSGAEDA